MKHFLGYSSATIFRYVKRTVNRPFNKQKLNKGRPKKLLLRDEQNIVRQITRMRSKIGSFKLKTLAHQAEPALLRMFLCQLSQEFLESMAFNTFLEQKGIMKPTDFTKCTKFAQTALKYPMDF